MPVVADIPHLPPAPDGRVRFSREAYHRMFEIGALSRAQRFELLDGEIVMMSPISPDHGALIRRLNRFFVRNLPASIDCSPQLPIAIRDHSEPGPDIALVRLRADDYRADHPEPSDVILLVEVSKSSLSLDLGAKLTLYAKSGIAEYWVVDVDRKLVIVHREPVGAGYREVQQFGSDATIAPLAVPDCKLDLGWLLR